MGYTFPFFAQFFKIYRARCLQGIKKAHDKVSYKEDAEIAHFYNNCEDLISVDECEPNSLVVFDDCVNIRQQHFTKDYFVRGPDFGWLRSYDRLNLRIEGNDY